MEGRQKSKFLVKRVENIGKIKSNKALSTVVTTLLIIGLSLVAITIIWVVIREVISEGSEKVEIGQFIVDLDLKKVVISENGTNVTVKRNPGKGNLSGIKFTISDGTNQYTFDNTNLILNELEEKTFSLNYTGIVKEVSIYPLSKQGASELTGNVADIQEFTAVQSVKNMAGLVSWWRMEGNANDEMGLNHGQVIGNPQLVDGKFGKAYNFSGTGSDYISISDNPSLRLEGANTSIFVWVNLDNSANGLIPLFFKGGGQCSVGISEGYCLSLNENLPNFFNIVVAVNGFSTSASNVVQKNSWYNIISATNLTSLPGTVTWKKYLNGNLNKTTSRINVPDLNSSGINVYFGLDDGGGTMYGIIDEVMIFNRTLSSQEASQLYSLDLNS